MTFSLRDLLVTPELLSAFIIVNFIGFLYFDQILISLYLRLQLKQKVIIHTGDPGEGICKIVSEYKPVMVVMGSRGLNLIRRTFMGSVSSYVLHHVDIPVVIIPAPGQ